MNPPRILSYHGQDVAAPELSRTKHIPQSTLLSRIDRLGWSVEKAADTPVDRRFRKGGRKPAGTPRACPVPRKDPKTGKAFVRWRAGGKLKGKWFGPWGSEQAKTAYAAFASAWADHHGKPPPDPGERVSISALCVRFRSYAQTRYVKGGKVTSEFHVYNAAMRTLIEAFGASPAAEFRPSQLRTLMDRWVAAGHARKTVNEYARKITRVFGYGVGRELIPASVIAPLREVEPLTPGATAAAEPTDVKAVPIGVVNATIDKMRGKRAASVAVMVRVQLLCKMRPGEVCGMTAEAIDHSREPWCYDTGLVNKNYHLGKPRKVWIGPEARALLAPTLKSTPAGRLFPISRTWYGRLVEKACVAANVEPWTPNQLRHTGATTVQRRYEDDAAVAIALGNTPEVARQVYVDDPADAVARRIAEATG